MVNWRSKGKRVRKRTPDDLGMGFVQMHTTWVRPRGEVRFSRGEAREEEVEVKKTSAEWPSRSGDGTDWSVAASKTRRGGNGTLIGGESARWRDGNNEEEEQGKRWRDGEMKR